MRRFPSPGFALIDSLIALAIIGVGLLGIIKFQAELFQDGAIAKQRTEAVILAQERIEQMRSFVDLSGYLAISEAAQGSTTPYSIETINGSSAQLTRTTYVTNHTAPYTYLSVSVMVSWTTSSGSTESATLNSAIAWVDPSQQGELIVGVPATSPQNCAAQLVIDNKCTGYAPATFHGATISVSYDKGGVGSGNWECADGSFNRILGTCSADCVTATVIDDKGCSGSVSAAGANSSQTVTYTSGGSGSGSWQCTEGSWIQQSSTCSPSCSLPWGGILANGGSVSAYTSATPTASCASIQGTLTCTDGVLSATPLSVQSYTSAACTEPCLSPWTGGNNIPFGNSILGYTAASNLSCTTNTCTCANAGSPNSSLDSTTMCTFQECVRTSGLSCILPDNSTINDGQSKTLFDNSLPPCNAVTFSCNNGVLSTGSNVIDITVYNSPHCGCSYAQTFSRSDRGKQFCSTGIPTGCSISPNSQKITCSGTVNYGTSVSNTPLFTPKNSNCSNTLSPVCPLPNLTCSADVADLTRESPIACTTN